MVRRQSSGPIWLTISAVLVAVVVIVILASRLSNPHRQESQRVDTQVKPPPAGAPESDAPSDYAGWQRWVYLRLPKHIRTRNGGYVEVREPVAYVGEGTPEIGSECRWLPVSSTVLQVLTPDEALLDCGRFVIHMRGLPVGDLADGTKIPTVYMARSMCGSLSRRALSTAETALAELQRQGDVYDGKGQRWPEQLAEAWRRAKEEVQRTADEWQRMQTCMPVAYVGTYRYVSVVGAGKTIASYVPVKPFNPALMPTEWK